MVANIVLHSVDDALKKLNDSNLLYLRFCDDMIMLHTNKRKLQHAFSVYQKELQRKRLFIHKPEKIDTYSAQYYDYKSKAPFAFGPSEKDMIPWITFVGYDINYLKEVRVRKRTINKQIKKQEEVVSNAIHVVRKSSAPVNRKQIIESIQSRLVGMSVGRIILWGDNSVKQMCWAKGFPCLSLNQYSIRQVKRLDRSRRKQINRLYKKIPENLYQDDNDKDAKKGVRKKRPIIYYGKPFSYYYWLENK